MANDIDKLAEAINRLAEAHETGLTDIAKTLEYIGREIGGLSDPDHGLAFESYSHLKTDISDALNELIELLKSKEQSTPKPKAKAKSN
jgi:predicted transcriptional regulator